MATDSLRRRTPLGPLADELRQACTGPGFSCREDAFRTLVEIRCPEAGASLTAEAIGLDLPAIGMAVERGGVFVLGLGPGWWLVDAPDGAPAIEGSAGVSAVDVSAQRTALVLTGSAVRDVLAHGTSFDVHPAYFVVGAAAQTLLAKAGIMLARTADDEYRLWVRASFARYLAAWLIDASVEYR